MQIGIPYVEAVKMPLDLAAAFLSDERLNNTHQQKTVQPTHAVPPVAKTTATSTTITKSYISNTRKHSKPKQN